MTDGKKRLRKRVRKSKGGNEGEEPVAALPTPAVAASTPAATSTPINGDDFYTRINPHKPSFLPRPSSFHRSTTLSLAIPGSIVLNSQSPELQSRLAGTIARTCAIFNVDEIVIFNDHSDEFTDTSFDPHVFLARVLQYLETPQYLRKLLFPMHKDLRLAGLMPSLDCPHHLRFEDESVYREGVVTRGAFVNVGLRDPVMVDKVAEEGMRVTVKMPTHEGGKGTLVSPREPVEKLGMYWGYTVRLASNLSSVLTESPYGEYDLVIGTSERGTSLTDLCRATLLNTRIGSTVPLPAYKHAMIIFGGLSGLEDAVSRDPTIHLSADTAPDLFDLWLNVVENQGSRTVRTEEAITIALARLKDALGM